MPAPPISALPPAPSRSDDPDNFSAKADAFLGALPAFRSQANTLGDYIDAVGVAADADAAAAASAAVAAASSKVAAESAASAAVAAAASAINAPGTNATSTTSMSVTVASKTFTIQTGKDFSVGQPVVIARTSAPTTRMTGVITAHNSSTGSMTVGMTSVSGSGTYTDWTISLTAIGATSTVDIIDYASDQAARQAVDQDLAISFALCF